MRFAILVAARYLGSNRAQTLLLLFGVALGVMFYTFNAALINGLAYFLIQRTVGNSPHVTIESPERVPQVFGTADGTVILAAIQPETQQRRQLRAWRSAVGIAEAAPGVKIVSPEVLGNALVSRGQTTAPISITGVEPERLSAIADIAGNLVDGSARLEINDILIGQKLADKLGLRVGQPIIVRSDRGRERVLTVRGLFSLGIESLDERVAYMNLRAARTLLDLEQGVSQIEIKLNDLNDAPEVARYLAAATGLKVTPWTEKNRQLREGIRAQGQSGALTKIFSLLLIVIGVASALLLTSYRRRTEIGIMRSFGVGKGFIVSVFLLQGLLIGLIGSTVGAGLGWGFGNFLVSLRENGGPSLPIDPAQGEYLTAIGLATLGSVLAAIWPARAAARVDPIEVINQ